jgi:hypothetical protein
MCPLESATNIVNDAACERAKQQNYAVVVYARSRPPSFLKAGVAARAR